MSQEEEQQNDDNFGFGLLGEALELDEEEDDIKKKPNRMAIQAEIKRMCDFIGGFEKWPQLIDDCKQKVIEFLDYKTAFSLSFCSKSDYQIVNKTPIYVHTVHLSDDETNHYQFQEEDFANVIVKVRFHHDFNTEKRFERIFSQSGEDTLIRWQQFIPRKRPENKEVILKNCNYYQEAVKFSESWMKRGNFGMDSVIVEMEKYPFDTSEIKFFSKCSYISVRSNDEDAFRWWLQKVPAQLDGIGLLTNGDDSDNFIISREFLSLPQIMNTKKFYFYCGADFSDEQMLNLKATRFAFTNMSITDEGINQFVKRWVNGKGVPGFTQAILWEENRDDDDLDRIIRGLEVRLWDEDFHEETEGYCEDFHRICGSGTTFQIASKIDPYESLTLLIKRDRVSIYHTGTKHVEKGQACTKYRILPY